MEYTQEEIELIKKIKIKDEEWDTSQYPYMTNKQIIEAHRYLYGNLVNQVKKLRGGVSFGDFGVPILFNNLLVETKKRFKSEKID